ncbi:hypothetical protein BC830DRAFT_1183762, partial [Chytriomyces sp. MP71]
RLLWRKPRKDLRDKLERNRREARVEFTRAIVGCATKWASSRQGRREARRDAAENHILWRLQTRVRRALQPFLPAFGVGKRAALLRCARRAKPDLREERESALSSCLPIPRLLRKVPVQQGKKGTAACTTWRDWLTAFSKIKSRSIPSPYTPRMDSVIAFLARMDSRIDGIHARLAAIETRQTVFEQVIKSQLIQVSSDAQKARFHALEVLKSHTRVQCTHAELKRELQYLTNPHRKFYTRFPQLPRELMGEIFIWMEPTKVLRYRRLARAFNECIMTKQFARPLMQRTCLPCTDEWNSLIAQKTCRFEILWPESFREACVEVMLQHVTTVDLDHQPVGIALPNSLIEQTQLVSLSLRNTRIFGQVPLNIGHLINLTDLDLGNNQLIGQIPFSIGLLVNMSALRLDSNPFDAGPIPDEFSNLSKLRFLNVCNTNRTGALPQWLGGTMKLLEELRLSHNKFSGSLPSSFGNLSQLLVLR